MDARAAWLDNMRNVTNAADHEPRIAAGMTAMAEPLMRWLESMIVELALADGAATEQPVPGRRRSPSRVERVARVVEHHPGGGGC